MLKLLNFDQDLAEACAAEFLASAPGRALLPQGAPARPVFLRLDNAPGDRPARCVLRMAVGETQLVLKIDQRPAAALAGEFAMLERLQAALAPHPSLGVVPPLYLSPGAGFFVTAFAPGETAWEQIRDPARAGEAYRLSGTWLAALHRVEPPKEGQFWPRWIFEKLDALLAEREPKAPRARHAPMIRALKEQAGALRGRPVRRCLCHGDIHPRNLLIDGTTVRGLDLAKAGRKMAILDLVDLFRADLECDGPEAEVDAGGVLRSSRAALLRGYDLPVEEDLLDFCLRGKMLIRWLSVTAALFDQSDFQQQRYAALERRLSLAFAQG